MNPDLVDLNDINTSHWIWLNDQAACSAQHLAEVSGLSVEEIDELIATRVIVPVDEATSPPAFALRWVVTATTARRLRDDFELDRNGVSLALTLMQRIEDLEAQVGSLRAQLDIQGRHLG